ncbi:hypothetical protein [Clostridium senegalense]|uniref:hypothetical protein n=1 Tax=Clostridium senegalense TaxID=1465809 RepID=UPI00028A3102|nr:hypothetical protein [Clostridium senegalense]
MNVLKCDKCNKDFILDMKRKIFQVSAIEVLYFKCPHCGERNIGVATDVVIRKQQEKVRKLNKELLKTKKEMSERMFKLKEKLEKEEF